MTQRTGPSAYFARDCCNTAPGGGIGGIVLNRYRGQRNHAETLRAVTFGGLFLGLWGATLSALTLLAGGGAVSVVDLPEVELPKVEIAAAHAGAPTATGRAVIEPAVRGTVAPEPTRMATALPGETAEN